MKPTVFADVSNDQTIAREDVFGPVLSIIPYGLGREYQQLQSIYLPAPSEG